MNIQEKSIVRKIKNGLLRIKTEIYCIENESEKNNRGAKVEYLTEIQNEIDKIISIYINHLLGIYGGKKEWKKYI